MTKTSYDFIVIGSGIAGLNIALLAQEHGSVLILTKGKIDDCNTRYAQGGIAAAIGPGDSTKLHFQDTLAAGVGLCDPEAVEVLTKDGPEQVSNLIHWGVAFDTIHGQIALGREGAHSVPRILHAGGDATGQHIEQALTEQVTKSSITVMEYTLATKLVVDHGKVMAVEALNSISGEQETYTSNIVVLATGGAGRLFAYTTNPQVATGDGVALAFRAGAQLMDMEFYQFHPTAFHKEGAPAFLLSEAMRGEGAVLRGRDGQTFMADYHPLGDLAPRDIVSRAIAAEMERTGTRCVYLDIAHLPPDKVQGRFPNIYHFCKGHGLDITRTPIPVAPAAHYMMGGVKTDTWGRTNIAGLYACGEAACSAVHGANRLASNSLLDTLVFANRLLDGALHSPSEPASGQDGGSVVFSPSSQPLEDVKAPPLDQATLQDLMWRSVGMNRNGCQLREAAGILHSWQQAMPRPTDLASHQLSNMVLLGLLMAEAAFLREESRGSHFRQDFPDTSAAWEKHVIAVQQEEES